MVQFPKWQVVVLVLGLLLGAAFAAPNLLPREVAEKLPGWVPSQQINLGLDLQGGSYLLLEVDLDAVMKEQLENLVDTLRIELRRARIGYTNLGIDGQSVVFKVRDPATIDRARQIAREAASDILISVSDDGTFRIRFTDQALEQRRQHIVEQSIEIVRRRIDETGTREPSIQRQGEDRI
ncbi:MAG: protein translocase subunit SecD, partial [Alphaproteobacteria bacterium]